MAEKSRPNLQVCIDRYVDSKIGFDEKEAPLIVDPRSTSREELALARYKLWQTGQHLRLRFLDGNSKLHEKVERDARKWLDFANLEFEFGNFSDAEIRITFTGKGFWSYVGTDALKCPAHQPTMTLGGLTGDTEEVRIRRAVLHEFGHAIGCVHEQASPSINIPWDKPKVYAWYQSNEGWDKATVDQNIFKRYGKSDVFFTENHDPKSIMQYSVPNELTIGDFEIGWNTELSETDKIFIAKMYPR